MNKLNITWCWPDILNLHGDRGNVMALVRIAEKMGLEAEVHKVVNFGDEIDLDNTDILLLNPGEFKSCEYIVNAFSRIKKPIVAPAIAKNAKKPKTNKQTTMANRLNHLTIFACFTPLSSVKNRHKKS